MRRALLLIGAVVVAALVGAAVFYARNVRLGPLISPPPANRHAILGELKVAPGFEISIFAEGLGSPRVIIRDTTGNLLVSIPAAGKVVALPDEDSDRRADQIMTVVDGLNRPHGLAFDSRGKLYIAEEHQVVSYDYDQRTLKAVNPKKLVSLPAGGNHVTRTLLFRPAPYANELLISVGSSCNVCEENDERRAAVLSVNVNSPNPTARVFAKGLRNTVFMTIHPVTGLVWGTDMGRDLLGDDLPPDEINIIQDGKNYGWPTCFGKNVHDAAYDKKIYIRNPCLESFETQSHIDIPAHSSPLGIAFVPEEGWPEGYWYGGLVAYHGSWNRTVPTGYKIVRYKLAPGGAYIGEEDFITGWLKDGKALGRPVGIITEPGGRVYITDDKAGLVYLVSRSQEQPSGVPLDMELLKLESPAPGSLIKSPLTVTGEARGFWYFEASFPVRVLDANGKELGVGIAQAEGPWMTVDLVPFRATVEFKAPATDTGFLVLEKDNPSGLPEHAQEIRYPVRFR